MMIRIFTNILRDYVIKLISPKISVMTVHKVTIKHELNKCDRGHFLFMEIRQSQGLIFMFYITINVYNIYAAVFDTSTFCLPINACL